MPQQNFYVAVRSGRLVPLQLDSTTNLNVQNGGVSTLLNVSVATVIKATPGRLRKMIIQVVGASGSWTFNDCATTGAATTANQVATFAYNATGVVAGLPITFDWPFQVGIVLSLVPASGSPVAAFSFD